MKILQTGCFLDNEFLFQTLELETTEYEELLERQESLKELAEKNEVDFITVNQQGELDFVHYSSLENQSFIEENGLCIRTENIGDLGTGLYAIYSRSFDKSSHLNGFDNVLTWLEGHEEDEVLEIEGSFIGEFAYCVFGEGHEGYLLLKNGHFVINNMEEVSLDDLFFR